MPYFIEPRVINLTGQRLTEVLVSMKVYDPEDEVLRKVKRLLTFGDTVTPTIEMINRRAEQLAEIARQDQAKYALIGGGETHFLMHPLVEALRERQIHPYYVYCLPQRVKVCMVNGIEKWVARPITDFVGID